MASKADRVYAVLEKALEKDNAKHILFDPENPRSQKVFSTGSFMLDYAIGIGGIPRGRVTELYGNPASSKTTVSFECAKSCQAEDLMVLLLDYEGAVDKEYAESMGVSFAKDKLLWLQPDTGEQGFTIARDLMASGVVGLVIVDSLAAVNPAAQFESDVVGESRGMGGLARFISTSLAQINPVITHHKVAWLFINQWWDSFSIVGPLRGRQQKTTPGGNAPKYYTSLRIQFTVIKGIDGKVRDLMSGTMEKGSVGAIVQARITKSKVAKPYGKAIFCVRYGMGIDKEMSLLTAATARGLVKQSGPSYKIPEMGNFEEISIRGLEATLSYLRKVRDHALMLEEKVKEVISSENESLKRVEVEFDDEVDENSMDGGEDLLNGEVQ